MKSRHFLPIALLCGALTGAFYARAQMWQPWVKGTASVGVTCNFGSPIGGQCRGFLTSGTSFTVPADWTSTNTIEAIGGGGGGASVNVAATVHPNGGGGGEYRKATNVTGLPATVTYAIGAGGAGGVFGGAAATSGGSTTFNGTTVVANGGTAGPGGTAATGGAGGTGGTGAIGNAGGAGGADKGGIPGGGGGAGGPGGVGGAGGATTASQVASGSGGANGGGGAGTGSTTANGGVGGASITTGSQTGAAGGAGGTQAGVAPGNGSAGSGGGAGAFDIVGDNGLAGGAGGAGREWDNTHGSGGGGGGGTVGDGSVNSAFKGGVGGAGGNYGGGGAGAGYTNSGNTPSGGAGAAGIIAITYTPTGGAAAIAFVQGQKATLGTGLGGTFTMTGVALGNMVIVGFGSLDTVSTSPGGVTTLTTNNSSTCAHVPGTSSVTAGATALAQDDLWYCRNAAAGPITFTATYNNSINSANIGMAEFSGVSATSPEIGLGKAAVANSVSVNSFGVTTNGNLTQSNQLIVSVGNCINCTTYTSGGSQIAVSTSDMFYQIGGTAGNPVTHTISATGTTAYTASIAVFKHD